MKRKLVFMVLLIITLPLLAQEQPVNIAAGEPFSFIGMRLGELLECFGTPETVFAARGNELWQDDVVFQYAAGDFFIYRDRIWQVRLSSAYGISIGDPKQAAVLVLGSNVSDRGDHLLLPVPAVAWPLMFRVNINNAGRVSAIFVYRPDY